MPGLDPNIVLKAGATSLRNSIDGGSLPVVLVAYSHAITQAFIISVVLACLTVVGSSFVEWKSVKGKKTDSVAA